MRTCCLRLWLWSSSDLVPCISRRKFWFVRWCPGLVFEFVCEWSFFGSLHYGFVSVGDGRASNGGQLAWRMLAAVACCGSGAVVVRSWWIERARAEALAWSSLRATIVATTVRRYPAERPPPPEGFQGLHFLVDHGPSARCSSGSSSGRGLGPWFITLGHGRVLDRRRRPFHPVGRRHGPRRIPGGVRFSGSPEQHVTKGASIVVASRTLTRLHRRVRSPRWSPGTVPIVIRVGIIVTTPVSCGTIPAIGIVSGDYVSGHPSSRVYNWPCGFSQPVGLGRRWLVGASPWHSLAFPITHVDSLTNHRYSGTPHPWASSRGLTFSSFVGPTVLREDRLPLVPSCLRLSPSISSSVVFLSPLGTGCPGRSVVASCLLAYRPDIPSTLRGYLICLMQGRPLSLAMVPWGSTLSQKGQMPAWNQLYVCILMLGLLALNPPAGGSIGVLLLS